jgi:hypothetical protein
MSKEEVFPEYEGRSLADIPGTVFSLFNLETDLTELDEDVIDTDEDYENVVLLLIDGLGASQVENFSRGFFQKMKEKGDMKTITSTFPSATPATLTTISTGRTPKEHGLLGWEMYYEEIDSNIYTLPFVTVEGEKPQSEGGDPEMLFEGEPIYSDLSENGVDCFSIVKDDIKDSEYTELTSEGSEKVPYLNTADMALQIRKTLEENSGDKYVYAYTADIDSIAHMRGPKTEDEENQLEMISKTLQRNLVEQLDEEVAENTLLLITADHGQIKHGEKVELFQWDKVAECLKTDSDGELITPTGNAGRSVFLHVKEEKVDELQNFLDEKLDAKVLKTGEALEQGYFGEGEKAERFEKRAGQLTIISEDRKLHWGEPETLEDVGVHGGLHPEEMNIPLLKVKLSEMKK